MKKLLLLLFIVGNLQLSFTSEKTTEKTVNKQVADFFETLGKHAEWGRYHYTESYQRNIEKCQKTIRDHLQTPLIQKALIRRAKEKTPSSDTYCPEENIPQFEFVILAGAEKNRQLDNPIRYIVSQIKEVCMNLEELEYAAKSTGELVNSCNTGDARDLLRPIGLIEESNTLQNIFLSAGFLASAGLLCYGAYKDYTMPTSEISRSGLKMAATIFAGMFIAHIKPISKLLSTDKKIDDTLNNTEIVEFKTIHQTIKDKFRCLSKTSCTQKYFLDKVKEKTKEETTRIVKDHILYEKKSEATNSDKLTQRITKVSEKTYNYWASLLPTQTESQQLLFSPSVHIETMATNLFIQEKKQIQMNNFDLLPTMIKQSRAIRQALTSYNNMLSTDHSLSFRVW